MEKVRAKFRCNSITDFGHAKKATLYAVYGSEGENADYAKATPNGEINITIDNDVPASGFFEIGKDYYIDFKIAESFGEPK